MMAVLPDLPSGLRVPEHEIGVEPDRAKGTETGRSKRLEPADVSAAVLRVLERPRFQLM